MLEQSRSAVSSLSRCKAADMNRTGATRQKAANQRRDGRTDTQEDEWRPKQSVTGGAVRKSSFLFMKSVTTGRMQTPHGGVGAGGGRGEEHQHRPCKTQLLVLRHQVHQSKHSDHTAYERKETKRRGQKRCGRCLEVVKVSLTRSASPWRRGAVQPDRVGAGMEVHIETFHMGRCWDV